MITTAFFLALGSNLQPQANVPRMLDSLLAISPVVDISPILITPLVGIPNSRNDFLNLVVRIQISQTAQELKAYLVSEEIRLGRDRSDPSSKIKDRVADMDILFAMERGLLDAPYHLLPEECYVRPQLLSLLTYLSLNCPDSDDPDMDCGILPCTTLTYHDYTIGYDPATLYQDPNNGRVLYVDRGWQMAGISPAEHLAG
jgi:2-amino-4-hydroxy-6-hydroxymethyldihydropteridine diphosphokinase